jgi:hypothetical protein
MDKLPDFKYSKEDIDYLLSTKAIRDKANLIYKNALEGKTNFSVDENKFEDVSNFVLETIKENYPDLNIPYHSRWGHFNSEKMNRTQEFFSLIKDFDMEERARREVDLIIVSVLLDAGAGADWKYMDSRTGETIARSEGLAIASYDMFCRGEFSNDPENDPYRVDADKLLNFSEDDLRKSFQVDTNNPLEGVSGRVDLLKSLGSAIKMKKNFFKEARPGSIVDYLKSISEEDKLEAHQILETLLRSLGKIWPSRISLGGQGMGDVWLYRPFLNGNGIDCLVPFHKLSQWLSYSLMESLERAKIKIIHIDTLTGLAEYRNGGLFVDLGVFSLKDSSDQKVGHRPDEDLIIEWRALTIIGLDKVASLIRKKLKISSIDFPLPKILEGGTWHAGRKVAKQIRGNGNPPIQIISDGTVF